MNDALPSVKKNYIYSLLYQILALAVPLITTPIVSRALTANGIGIYSFTHSMDTYCVLIGNLGITGYAQLKTSALREDVEARSKLFFEVLISRALTLGTCLFIYIIIAINISFEYKVVMFINGINIVASVFDISWFYQGLEMFRKTVVKNAIVKIISTFSIIWLIKEPKDLNLYVLILALSTLLGNFTFWWKLGEYTTHVHVEKKNIVMHISKSMIYFVPAISSSVYTILDKTMIGVITTSNMQNGYYEQVSKITRICISCLASLGNVTLPRMAYYRVNDNTEQIKILFKKSLSVLLMISIPLSVGLASISAVFVPWFFGTGYEECISLMRISSLIIVETCLTDLITFQLLMPLGRQSKLNVSVCIGAASNLLLNIGFIFKFQAFGACLASVISQGIILCLMLYYVREWITIGEVVKLSSKYLFASLIMAIVTYYLSANLSMSTFNIIIITVGGAVLYFVCLLIFRDSFFYEALKIIMRKWR